MQLSSFQSSILAFRFLKDLWIKSNKLKGAKNRVCTCTYPKLIYFPAALFFLMRKRVSNYSKVLGFVGWLVIGPLLGLLVGVSVGCVVGESVGRFVGAKLG